MTPTLTAPTIICPVLEGSRLLLLSFLPRFAFDFGLESWTDTNWPITPVTDLWQNTHTVAIARL